MAKKKTASKGTRGTGKRATRAASRAQTQAPPGEEPPRVEPQNLAAEAATGSHAPVIVGVGMSAGGLEACAQLLEHLPAKPGFALVLIQHLAPNYRSFLPALLAERSQLPVIEVTDGILVESDRAYVIPPGAQMELADGALQLTPRPTEADSHPLPVDFFLRSLAEVQGNRAIAVILSGTGTDGAAGVRAVRAAQGKVLAQSPDSAKYDGMPKAAIDSGMVDEVLPPGEIGPRLVEIARSLSAAPLMRLEDRVAFTEEHFDRIFEVLHRISGVDFAHYKQPTIKRRILRRMSVRRLTSVDQYIALLQSNAEEGRALYHDVLIHVTRFFREPDTFDAIAQHVLGKILDGRRPDDPVRVWVAGCATGEEAYSLAITLFETAGDALNTCGVQVFATDLSEPTVEFARQGVYPQNIAQDVPPDILRRYFTRTDGGYRISKAIRDHCVFARQDLTRDPPFSKLDLILCRNVLIYMDAALQRKVVPIFHYALKTSGYLALGQAEAISTATDLFALVDKKHKIYRKRPLEHVALGLPMATYVPQASALPHREAPVSGGDARVVQNEANRVVLDRYGPPGVLVNDDMQIVQFRGRTGPFLEPAPGDASLNLLKLAREGLLHGLRAAVETARRTRKPVRKENLRVRSNGGWTDIDLEVLPLTSMEALHYVVLFEPRPPSGRRPPVRKEPAHKDPRRLERLEEELSATREYLQSIIQELEAANEELQSANEEILSSNEELQSTNEELDTEKEELQSTNEELNTLNEELHARNEELTLVNSDLLNLLGSVQIAVVIVGRDLRVRRFTPMAEKALNLIPGDIGRPITQVKPTFDCPDLGDLILGVIDRVAPVEREVRDEDGHWYSLRVRPYKGLENRIDGAVLALVDIDVPKRYEADLTRGRHLAESLMQIVPDRALALLDGTLRVTTANEAFYRTFGVGRSDVEGRSMFDIGDGRLANPDVRNAIESAVRDRQAVDGVEVVSDGKRRLRIRAQPVDGGDGKAAVVVALTDVEQSGT